MRTSGPAAARSSVSSVCRLAFAVASESDTHEMTAAVFLARAQLVMSLPPMETVMSPTSARWALMNAAAALAWVCVG